MARRFLIAELAWTAGIFLLMLPFALMDNDPPSAARFAGWLARALGVAAFPAGIAVAPEVFGGTRPWRAILVAIGAASVVALAVFLLHGIIAPALGDPARTLPELMRVMRAGEASWESRNDAAWDLYTALLAPLNALLFAAIGAQVGIWASHALPLTLRRALYWAIGLGLLVSGFAVWDTAYETVVLHTAADASFAPFLTVLIPAFLCAGLALPTLALLMRPDLVRPAS